MIIILLSLLFITLIRLLWLNFLTTFEYADIPLAKNGELDLSDVAFSNEQKLSLNGEWEFYPSEFIPVEEFAREKPMNNEKVHLSVPSTWNEAFPDEDKHGFHYGTYRLKILLDDHKVDDFGIKFNDTKNALRVYADGILIGDVGEVSSNVEDYQPHTVPYTTFLTPKDNEVNLVIYSAGYGENAGLSNPIYFGTSDAIHTWNSLSIGLQLLLCVVLLFHCIYAAILYFLGQKRKVLLYFLLFILCAFLSTIVSDDKILFYWVDIGYEWEIKLVYFSYIGIAVFLPKMLNSLLPQLINQRYIRWFARGGGVYALFVLVSPFQYIIATSFVLLTSVLLLSLILSLSILQRAIKHKEENAVFLLLACIVVGVNIVWVVMQRYLSIDYIHYPFDLIFALLFFSAFWFQRFFAAINKSKKLTETLQLEDERKDRFLVNTSHELRNPLYGIVNTAQSILDDPVHPINTTHRERLELLIRISNNMVIILDDLIDVTMLKEKMIQLHPTKVNVQSVLCGVLDMIQHMLGGKPIHLQTDMPNRDLFVYADESRFIQILFNLLHNAIKYTDEGTIMVKADVQMDMVQIHIEDTGIGMEKRDLETLFNPYHQADTNEKRASGGFGLGLSICKQLVEIQGGTLTVQSTLGEGSIFTFTLPLFQNVESTKQENIPVSKHDLDRDVNVQAKVERNHMIDHNLDPDKPHILIVDDDSVNLRTIIYLLEIEEYRITAVTSAEQAMEKLENHHFSLVISDVMMPNISGYELTRFIRNRYMISELPVLLLTARSRLEDIVTAYQVGANDYIKKPVDGKVLKARVRALTDLKKSIDERLRMEGAWLQSQIQPHFLFNTLNSIAALGLIEPNKMQLLLEEFGNYLRLSFDFENASPTIPLEQELNLVHSYLYIEKVRFDDRLNVRWKIEADTDTLIPPLTIQPLMENAIRHGIMKRSIGGEIILNITDQQEYIEVVIKDNGVGMDPTTLNNIFKPSENERERKGIGILNINRRLKQLYGDGLSIDSVPDLGTTVSFQIRKDSF